MENFPVTKRTTVTELRKEIAELKSQLKPLQEHYDRTVEAAIGALPNDARTHYLAHPKVATQEELLDLLLDLPLLVMKGVRLLPERHPDEHFYFSERAQCPLCASHPIGRPREEGWAYPDGLQPHLQGRWPFQRNGCHVMQTLVEHARHEFSQRMQSQP